MFKCCFAVCAALCLFEVNAMKVWNRVQDVYTTKKEISSNQRTSSEVRDIINNTAKCDLNNAERVAILWKAQFVLNGVFQVDVLTAVNKILEQIEPSYLELNNYEYQIARLLIQSQTHNPAEVLNTQNFEIKSPYESCIISLVKDLLQMSSNKEAPTLLEALNRKI